MKTNIEIYFEILIFSWTLPLSSVQVEVMLEVTVDRPEIPALCISDGLRIQAL